MARMLWPHQEVLHDLRLKIVLMDITFIRDRNLMHEQTSQTSKPDQGLIPGHLWPLTKTLSLKRSQHLTTELSCMALSTP